MNRETWCFVGVELKETVASLPNAPDRQICLTVPMLAQWLPIRFSQAASFGH